MGQAFGYKLTVSVGVRHDNRLKSTDAGHPTQHEAPLKKVLLFLLIGAFVLIGVCTTCTAAIVIFSDLEDPSAESEEASTPVSTTTAPPSATQTPSVTHTPTAIPQPTATLGPITSIEELVERYENSIGLITASTGVASGFIVAVEGETAFVVTNHHVVDGATDMKIELGGQTYDLNLLGSHEYEDVAVLSICCGTFTPIPHSTMPVTPGTQVVAVGFPGRTRQAIHSQGQVVRLTQQYGSSSPVLEHSAELHPGQLGQPALHK